jgi:hypothetical protein
MQPEHHKDPRAAAPGQRGGQKRMAFDENTHSAPDVATPHSALKRLDRLVGTWQMGVELPALTRTTSADA